MKNLLNWKNWIDNPITWRDYINLSFWCTVLAYVMGGLYMVYLYWDEIKNWFLGLFKKKKEVIDIDEF